MGQHDGFQTFHRIRVAWFRAANLNEHSNRVLINNLGQYAGRRSNKTLLNTKLARRGERRMGDRLADLQKCFFATESHDCRLAQDLDHRLFLQGIDGAF